MPISLSVHRNKLAVQLETLTSGFNRHLMVAGSQRRLDRTAIREGLISALWQSWCRFFRSVVLTSAAGGITSAGARLTCTFGSIPESHLLFVAKQLAVGAGITTIKAIAGSHLEPTWGDINKAILIVSGMGLSNSPQLLSALSLATAVPDLQICRNATAHLGPDQI
ncbi:MAG: hypothetical protein EOO38_07835, partial [Cytophagaceae bacterium]